MHACTGFGYSIQVQCVSWWMALYGSKTAKRHYAFGNSRMILGLDRGVLRRPKKATPKVVTAVHYTDRHGKRRYKGTKELRKTEYPDFRICFVISFFLPQGLFFQLLDPAAAYDPYISFIGHELYITGKETTANMTDDTVKLTTGIWYPMLF